MNARRLLDLIISQGPTSPTLPLELRRAFFKLHDHLPEIELRNGERVRDVADVMELFREMIDHLAPDSISFRGPLKMYDVCPSCFHVHQEAGECGVDLGGAGKCDCKAEIPA